MKLEDWLSKNTGDLQEANIATGRLDCLVLLEDSLQKDRAYLLAHPEIIIQDQALETLNQQIEERKKHIPLAQIRGKTEFYGREFIINQDVLEPRPESETMIELLKGLKLPRNPIIADVGTGSGAIGITAALELSGSAVILTDIDSGCLALARKNAKKYAVKAQFLETDLLENVPVADVILANLPYVPDSYEINQAALNEPRTAIFGGADGLDLYRKLFEQLASGAKKPAYVLTESLPFQHEKLAVIAQKSVYNLLKTDDFIQVFKPV